MVAYRPGRGASLRTAFLLAVVLLLAAATTAPAAVRSLQTYGEPGTDGPGGVGYLEGLGVDPVSGKVVAADGGLDRISVFSPKGEFLLAFGTDVVPGGGTGPEVCKQSCQAGAGGAGAGNLSGILEAEVSPDGRIYVSEDANNRVSVFTMKGKFLFAFGADVDPAGLAGPEICTTVCKAGVADSFGGAFHQPWASTFGPDGNLYITNTDNHRIDEFTPAGNHIRGTGKDVNVNAGTGVETCVTDECKLGDSGGGPASLPRPEGIDFDPSGRIWVGSWNGIRLNAFTSEGFLFGLGTDVVPGAPGGFEKCTASCQNGSSGAGPGEFASVQGVAVDAAGTVYAADTGNNRVNAYRSDGSFLRSIGYGVGGGSDLETCKASCQAGLELGGTDDVYPVQTNCRGTIFVSSDSTGLTEAIGPGRAKPGPCKLRVEKVRAKRNGTAKLKVLTPFAGKLSASGKGIKRAKAEHEGLEGVETLALKPKGAVKRKLARVGRAKVKVTAKLKPADGNVVQAVVRKLKLKQR